MDQPTFKGDTSADVVKDDPNLKEPQPSAPPIENMDHINGYDGVTFGGGWCTNKHSYLTFYTKLSINNDQFSHVGELSVCSWKVLICLNNKKEKVIAFKWLGYLGLS